MAHASRKRKRIVEQVAGDRPCWWCGQQCWRYRAQKLHHLRTGWEAGGRLADRTGFYRQIAAALATYGNIVITGPGNTKFELKAFLDELHPQISVRVEESTPGSTAVARTMHDQ